ncbi:MAG TPA: tetratricopeptide repeat protein [Terriglobia bacterium]|nr:tetratricopeptide repeat protein [Terriglobia bacterium]
MRWFRKVAAEPRNNVAHGAAAEPRNNVAHGAAAEPRNNVAHGAAAEPRNNVAHGAAAEPRVAAERRKNVAHGVSRGMNVSCDPAPEGRKILSPLRGSPESKPSPRPHGRGYILSPLRGWKPSFVPSPLRGWKPPFVASLLSGWGKSLLVALIVVFSIAAHAEIPVWVQWLPATSPASSVLYRMLPMLGGSTSVRRPPRETAPGLAALSARSPSDVELITLTAREYEAQLDFTNAEARWKLLDSLSADRVTSQIALADYYHRRIQPQQELLALAAADARLPAIEDRLQPEAQQRAWKLHERIQQLIQAEGMPAMLAAQDYEAWIAKYPRADSLYRNYFDFLLENGMVTAGTQLLDRYQRTFPNDRFFPVHARTSIAEKRGAAGGAIAVYDAAFDPLWPQGLLDGYFNLLAESHKLFDFYQNARRDAIARPLDLAPAARLFHYYKKQSDVSAARRELSEFRVRKEEVKASWTAAELDTLSKLFDSVNDYDETVRYAYALYSLPGGDAASQETALVQIITTLLKAPNQPIRFGRGDLSFYRDIATIDRSPGFLNGILSLIFNSQYPDGQFRSQEQKSEAYFHRAKAAELYALLSNRFPRSTRRSELLSRIIESYAVYGEDEAIIRQGTAFINDFPDAEQRTKVALQVADAYARRKQVPEELTVYDRLLAELAAKAQQVPLGSGRPRSADYAQVLQRYISRLSQLNRIPDALALYRRELDRNPDDPGLYDRLADFLGANQRAGEIEQIYRRAIQRFQDRSWWHKLARFYLRNKLANELRTLSRQVVDTFSGTDVEQYFGDVIADGALERRFQLEINLYAHTRFPHDLRFVHNLSSLYSADVTADPAALTRLLADHWYEDESIRRMYFERLSATGALAGAVRGAVDLFPATSRGSWAEMQAANPAVTRFIAEAEAWQSHFETASTTMRAVAAAYPADTVFAGRASELYRSLGAYDAGNTTVAASIAEDLARSEPRNRERITRLGEIHADRELMTTARSVWARLPGIEPGKPEGYLQAATLFWDYLSPSDALNWLQRGRARLKNPTLWAYEMGAIFESQSRRPEAVAEYVKGALSRQSGPSQARLIRLATRQDFRMLVDDQTKRRMDASPEDPAVLKLRVNVLRAQERQSDVESLLQATIDRTSSREILSYVRQVADEAALRPVQERVIRREVQLESDPQEQLRRRLELAHFLEARGDLAAAQSEFESIYQANSLIIGVIRATADYYWRHDKPRAIRVLTTAAERAHASLKKDYLVETARKSIEARRYADAIQSAESLLRVDPISGQFVALMGDALAAAGREAELQQLYVSKISEIQQSQISQSEKTDRIAAMRRGLIPVFVRQGKFREALDQFIEIINRFPEDEIVLAEAGRLASQQNLRTQLTDYYARTVASSPRDPRWSIVLARLHTQFENYPAAIEAYTKAMTARPERQDLAIARADLEERTFRFADAIVTCNVIYELSHKNSVWLEHIAVLQARLGQNREAIATLQRAYIENRPEASREYGRVALVLEGIGIADAAADFIQQQMGSAQSAGSGQPQWQQPYARIMTRARRYNDAFQRVLGFDNTTVARAMGQAVAVYFTPEEKQAFALLLTQRKPAAGQQQLRHFIEIANSARLYDLEVQWRLEQAAQSNTAQREIGFGGGTFVPLQQRRMRFAELARQLEDLASRVPTEERSGLLAIAMSAYEEIGDTASELQLLTAHSELQVNNRGRYYELLAQARPDQLLSIAGQTPANSDGLLATQVLVASGDQTRATQSIKVQKRNPVWSDAYTSLVGMYFGLNSPDVRSAFQRALGSQLIQERLGKPVDRASQLAGDVWAYYGQRYGEYLRDAGESQAAAEYLPAQVEFRPGDPQAYLELARYYQQSGEPERALTEFRHALDLDEKRQEIHSNIALLLWDTGRRNEALAEWKNGLAKFEKLPNPAAGSLMFRDIRSRQQMDALRAEMDSALRAAARTLQVWQLPLLLQAAFENSPEEQWLLDIVQVSRSPGQLLANLEGQSWLSARQRRLVLQTAVSVLSTSTGRGRLEYQQARQRYLEYLLDNVDVPAARQLLDSLTDAERRGASVQQAEIRLAAMEGSLEALLENYRKDVSQAPSDYILQETAATLDRKGLPNVSQRVLEFLYSRQIENSSINNTSFLGLAEIRLKQGRLNEALDLLKRLNRVSAVPFEHLLASARVLSAGGHRAEAEEFLKLRIQAVPWDEEARLELAKIQPAAAAENLQRVVTSLQASYDIRAQAAREQAKAGPSQPASTGSRELDLLSGRVQMTPDAADAPYFFPARIAAAEQSGDAAVRVRLLLGAIAERPDDFAIRERLFSAALESRQYHVALAAYRRADRSVPENAARLAEAHLQLGQPGDAAQLLGIAAFEEKDAARKQALEQRRKQAQDATDRMIENERRRPVIRADVDQPNPVRRRLP